MKMDRWLYGLILAGLLGLMLFGWSVPRLLDHQRLSLQVDSLQQELTGLQDIRYELQRLQQQETVARHLLAGRLGLTIPEDEESNLVGHRIAGEGGSPASDKIPILNPVAGVISQEYHTKPSLVHQGVDIAAPAGTPVVAPADSRVLYTGWDDRLGNLVILQHEDGIVTHFGHLNRIFVEPSQRLSQGDPLGEIGSTGRSTGPHLHYEIWMNGRPVNPMFWLKH